MYICTHSINDLLIEVNISFNYHYFHFLSLPKGVRCVGVTRSPLNKNHVHVHVHVYIHFILFRHETGGELHVVEDILHHIYATPTLTPNMLSDRIRPLLYTSEIIYIYTYYVTIITWDLYIQCTIFVHVTISTCHHHYMYMHVTITTLLLIHTIIVHVTSVSEHVTVDTCDHY